MADQGASIHGEDLEGVAAGSGTRIEQSLRRIRRRAKAMLVAQRAGVVAAWVVGLCIAAGFIDFVLRTPSGMRGALLGLGVLALLWAVWRVVMPALRFAPSLTEVALRIERSPGGRGAGLEGVLASGLELARGGASEPVVAEAEKRFGAARSIRALSSGRTALGVSALVAVVAIGAGVASGYPKLAIIGARRLLTPWAGAQWPKLTEVADATGVTVHPLGTALPLRAAVLKSTGGFGQDVVAARTHVAAKYRVISEGISGPVRRVLLTSQDKLVDVQRPKPDWIGEHIAGDTVSRTGMLFERLIEPAGLTAGAPHDGPARARQFELEYWFETDDDRTEARRVLLVEPPAVVSARVEVVPPEYAAGVPATEGAEPDVAGGRRQVELGAGNDERAVPAPILAGSSVRMVIELNKPVPTPTIPQRRAEWIAASLGADIAKLAHAEEATRAADEPGAARKPGAFRGEFGGQHWVLEWTLRQTVRVPVRVTDEHGITGVEESVYVLEALEDRAPTATVTEPQEDRTVLSTATVEVRGEGRDDVGLDWVTLETRLARPPVASEGAPAEPVEEWVERARTQGAGAAPTSGGAEPPAHAGVLPTRLEITRTLDLSTMQLKSGDELWLSALAADAYRLDGAAHDPGRSPVRKLRIISVEQLVEQVWADLAGIRRSAIGLEEEQARLTRDAQRSGEAARLERSQAGLTERIARDRQALDRVQQRIEQNGLKDETLEDVLRQGQRLLDEAGRSSVDASGDLKDAAELEQRNAGADSKPQREKAGQSQQQVRDRLAELIELLDQGEDTWAMRRAVERVLAEQRDLKNRTAGAAQQTTGRDLNQLTPQEREQLEQIAADQKSLSQKAQQAIQQMVDAQQQMQKKDPAGADALAEAARRGQRDQVPQRMEQAGQQVQQNQTNSAQGQQDRAIESLEQMLQSLQNASRNRDEVLRRKLASLIESLEGLIREQEQQMTLLDAGREKNDLSGLPAGMAKLHQNTLGVLDEASQGPRELAPVAELIASAGEAQAFAVVALRSEPANPDEAQGQETISLEKLKEAKALAQRLDEEAANRQTARKRAELKKAYAEALADQMEIRGDTEPLVGAEATRRTRATARSLGERQGTLQEQMIKLESETHDLSDTVLFSYAHKRLDETMGKAATGLATGEADRTITFNQDRAVRVLRSLVQALEDAQQNDNEFRNQQQPGGGGNQGGGQAPLVPPMAELKLLKAMQEEAADLTREIGSAGDGGAAAGEMEAVGKLQRDLSDHAATLIKKLMEGPQGRQAPAGPAPAPDQPDTPAPPAPPGNGDAG